MTMRWNDTPTREGEPVRVQVLRLRGELTLEDVLKVKKLLDDYMKAGLFRVVLDFSAVSHIHLSGLPVLVERARKFREYGGDVKLSGCSTYIMHILELAGASRDFVFAEDEGAAADQFVAEGRKLDAKERPHGS